MPTVYLRCVSITHDTNSLAVFRLKKSEIGDDLFQTIDRGGRREESEESNGTIHFLLEEGLSH